ncbi:galactose-3-O-sulfotransferase-domain-containing protein [Cladochytrium replicatum]|nr:galactose-3-O-sulfotransferase-domain-containing protein [Cladochytrium replicatum]
MPISVHHYKPNKIIRFSVLVIAIWTASFVLQTHLFSSERSGSPCSQSDHDRSLFQHVSPTQSQNDTAVVKPSESPTNVSEHEPRNTTSPRYIFIKTHKTGSTTLGSIFFRYGVRHKLKIFVPADHYANRTDFEAEQIKASDNQNSNIYLNHFSPENDPWFVNNSVRFTTENLISMYRRGVPNGMAVTVLREPHARYISHFFYLVQPNDNGKTLENYAKYPEVYAPAQWSYNWNRQSQELGIGNEEELERFLRYEKDQYFGMILITEFFDESLVLMRRKFGWDKQDILYVKLLDSCSDGHRWDNRAVSCSGKTVKEIMSERKHANTRKLIEQANLLDTKLYNAVREGLEKELKEQAADFWQEVDALKKSIAELKEKCKDFATLNSPEQLELMSWIQNGSLRGNFSDTEMTKRLERRDSFLDQKSFYMAREKVEDLTIARQFSVTQENGNDINERGLRSTKEREDISDGVIADVLKRSKRNVVIEGKRVDPYPCFPYSISDMHYEQLARLGHGYVRYMPGMVPSEQDRF